MEGQRSLFNSPQQLSVSPLQAKLTIGEPGDKYEQEADRVASQVVEQINAPAPAQSTQGQSVQRQEEKPEELQAKSTLKSGEEIAGGEASTDLASAINSARGSGQPLDAGLQRSIGQAMGTDFSGVRVHTDAQSDQLNRSIQAKAFTTGQDVFFRQGEYNPGSRGGQELIAHELTHVVQQSGRTVQRSPSDPVFFSAPLVAQRLATDSIEQPEEQEIDQEENADRKSDIVPDLTVRLVKAIQNAAAAEARRNVLRDLKQYLIDKGVVDDPDLTQITYNGRANGNNQALTGYVLPPNQHVINDDTPITITVYPSAFAAGPAALYSTIRHELIHAAQRMKVPDDPTEMTDDYIQEDIYTQIGQRTTASLQIPMQEIEAHVWEVNHANETGINEQYNTTTLNMLAHYIDLVRAAVSSTDILPHPSFAYWKGYIYKTLLTAQNCENKTLEVIEAIADLEDAIENREQLYLNDQVQNGAFDNVENMEV
jgi:hypothetical protein